MTLRAHRTPSAAMGAGLLVMVLAGGLGYFGLGAWRTSSEPVSLTDTSVSIEESTSTSLQPPEPVEDFIPAPEPEAPSNDLSAVDGEEEVEEEPSIPENISEVQPEALNEESRQAATPEVIEGELQMVVRFREDCWIEISDASNRTLVSEVRQGGSRLELSVRPPVKVRMGNAPGVAEMTLNGEPVEIAPGRKVASLVLDPVRG